MSERHSWLLKDLLQRWGGGEPGPPLPADYPAELEGWFEAPEGERVRVRPVRPEDGPLLRAGLAELSPETVYRRFHGALERFTDDELRYLTHLDYQDHLALMAVDPDGSRAIGVARYYRPEGRELAEAAIVVADDWQGRGLGGYLLKGLRDAAEARGVAGFEAWVQPDNLAVLGLLNRRGFALHTAEEDGALHIWFRFDELFS